MSPPGIAFVTGTQPARASRTQRAPSCRGIALAKRSSNQEVEMSKTMLTHCAVVLLSAAGLYSGCNDTVALKDCRLKCQDVDNTCVQKCTDDACKTTCKTDLDNCAASCDAVMVTPPDGGY